MTKLFERIYGCEAAGTIANAMGDVPEGYTYKQIEEKWGFIDTCLPQFRDARVRKNTWGLGPDLISHAHHRPAGMTEDGMERHRLVTSAIIRKGGRIDIIDLAKSWVEHIDPAKFGFSLGPQDQVIYYSLKAGIPPWEVGKFASWPGFIGTTKMIMPVGMVNACNPEQAAKDALELGRIKDVRGVPGNYALEVCAAVAAAAAEALRPEASVDGIIDVALSCLSEVPRKEVELGLGWAKNADSWKDLRPLYDDKYRGFPMSNAVEMLSAGLACFWIADGRPKETILYAVNLGRDTDCKAYIGASLAGALHGIGAVPADWVQTVEYAAANDPYTVSRRTAREAAEGIYEAALNTLEQQRNTVESLKQLL
ncbi:ADP-ribosylglycohydrolase family protein [Paenibacillus piri]|uniref:ADP-ribosylglycohydrolase family protein n=1 Tax=Paenibacillus piri TaxID=2547395 RepID=A0A4R5KMZ7_9BACL|nr:ADP-ribosylglycohydrolase family protein [Paenibacillus piri]TDF95940.1 hypothetical protein E1757_19675 [Paenibacillus piri]